MLRPRTVIYPIALTAFLGAFIYGLSTKAAADVTLLRAVGNPFTVDASGYVTNQVRLKIANRSGADQAYRIEVAGAETGTVVVPMNPFLVARGLNETTSFFVTLPPGAFAAGEPAIAVRITDGTGYDQTFSWRLLGPSQPTGGDAAPFNRGTL
jgi:polyferredoxin